MYYSSYLFEPESFKEAVNSIDSHLWKEAIRDELSPMNQHKVWTVVPKTQSTRTVGSKWLFVRKRDEYGEISRYKARLVAQGYSQRTWH